VALNAILAVVLSSQLRDQRDDPVLPAGGMHRAAVAIEDVSEFSLPADSAFAEIVQRPVFSRNRRPPELSRPKEGGGPQSSELPDLLLVGVIISSDRRVALFDDDSSELLRLAEGETLDGWTLETIQPDAVVFRHGTASQAMELKALTRDIVAE
jgi:hypothetical protein